MAPVAPVPIARACAPMPCDELILKDAVIVPVAPAEPPTASAPLTDTAPEAPRPAFPILIPAANILPKAVIEPDVLITPVAPGDDVPTPILPVIVN